MVDWWKNKRGSEITNLCYSALMCRYPIPEWLCLEEVCINDRRLDCLVVHMWQKFHTLAFEIKASKQDFKKELTNLSKRDDAEKVANEVYFVAPSGLLSPDEMPEYWGLLEVFETGKIRQKKAAVQRHIEAWHPNVTRTILSRAANLSQLFPIEFPAEDAWKAIWKIAGQELSLHDIVGFVKTIFVGFKYLNQDIGAYKRDYQKTKENDPEYVMLKKLEDLVLKHISYWKPTDDLYLQRVADWMEAQKTVKYLSSDVVHALKAVEKTVAEALEKMEKECQKEN